MAPLQARHWVVVLVVVVRLYGGVVSGVADCDEVYNYWEGVHLLAYSGDFRRPFQTWEYAPNFALRSWAFVAPYAALARALGGDGTLAVFRAVRCLGLALPCAAAEAALVEAVSGAFGGGAGLSLAGLLLSSAGLFSASNALLPSSAAMVLAAASQACWLSERRAGAVFFGVAATLWPGWPFVAVLFVPLFLDVVAREVAARGALGGALRAASYGLWSGVAIGAPVVLFDCAAYGRLVSPLVEVFRYNAAQGGDELYGVEPWTFYAKNLALNCGVAAALAVALPLVLAVGGAAGTGDPRRPRLRALCHAAPAALWLAVLLARPHKEERFLFPALPSLYVAAAVALDEAATVAAAALARVATPRATRTAVRAVALFAALAAGAARATAVATYYGGPQMAAWTFASDAARRAAPARVTVCVGAEWHRYPSTFALPPNARLAFVKTAFDGQLPRAYDAPEAPGLAGALAVASADVAAHFNDRNAERLDAYVDAGACDLAVDLRFKGGDDAAAAPSLASALRADGREWKAAHRSPFLDAGRTPALARAFAIPGYSRSRAVFADYEVLAPTTS